MSSEGLCPGTETAFIIVISIVVVVMMMMMIRKIAPNAGTREIHVVDYSCEVIHQMQFCIPINVLRRRYFYDVISSL